MPSLNLEVLQHTVGEGWMTQLQRVCLIYVKPWGNHPLSKQNQGLGFTPQFPEDTDFLIDEGFETQSSKMHSGECFLE